MPIQNDIATQSQNGVHTNGVSSHNGKATQNGDVNTLLQTVLPGSVSQTGNYQVYSIQLSIETSVDVPNFTDITEQVRQVIADSGIRMGTATVFSRHTTAAVKINENEPLLLTDMCQRLSRIFPAEEYYRHNDWNIRTHNITPDEAPNGHSHCQHLLLATSETIPVMEGQLGLGRWQSIFLIELDRPLKRTVTVVVSGIL